MGKIESKGFPTQHNEKKFRYARFVAKKTANNTPSFYARDRNWRIPHSKTGARRPYLTSQNTSANSHQDCDAPWLRHIEILSRMTGINHSDYGKDSFHPLR